jgi:hypothetical protein
VSALGGGELGHDQREKNNIIDPEHDLQQRQVPSASQALGSVIHANNIVQSPAK